MSEFLDVNKMKLEALFKEYDKINSGIDDRVKMVDSLTNISLLITAGYLTILGFGDVPSWNSNLFIVVGVIIMQYFIILQILRNDYLTLNLVEYYYGNIRKKVETLLDVPSLSLWEYEHFKFETFGKTKIDKVQFNLLALIRYGIPFVSCILILVQYIIESGDKISEKPIPHIVFFMIIIIATIILFAIMLYWAYYSTNRTKQLIEEQKTQIKTEP